MFEISELRIENTTRNVVTDNLKPRISFALQSDTPGTKLMEAKIRIGGWETTVHDQIQIRYGGPELQPFTRYDVTVEATDQTDNKCIANGNFLTGRLGTPWSAKWITDAKMKVADKVSPPPLFFIKKFIVGNNVARAFIVASALGVLEIDLNGRKVGDEYFAPGLTSYKHQIQYSYYDVTSQIDAENELRVLVGAGWAVGRFTYRSVNKITSDRQALLLELHLEYENGAKEVIVSDDSWTVNPVSEYQFADFYDGEIFDASFIDDQSSAKVAQIYKLKFKPKIIARYGEAVTRHELLEPIAIFRAANGETIYDFGQNIAGVITFSLKATAGQRIVFRHAEVLFKGDLFVKSLRSAKARIEYIAKTGEQSYTPRFTYMGFRFVGVSGIEKEDLELKAYALYSDFETTGTFACSNKNLNQLHNNIVWGGKSNFVDIPTDCPQRDERQGWTGDLAVFARTACYNFDLSRFLEKWLADVKAEQGRGGGIPMVVPLHGDKWPIMATACWGDACILVPWAEYLSRGDISLLEEHYSMMKKFLKAAKWWAGLFSFRRYQKLIWKYPFHFGDWCAPDIGIKEWLKRGPWIATAYFSNSCAIVGEIANLLGKQDEAKHYFELSKKISRAYHEVFTDKKGTLKQEFQTAYVLPLHFNMTSGEIEQTMAVNLARLVKEADYHLSTGFPSTPYLLFALADHGYVDEAFRVLLQDTCPSWLYEVKAGGTTIWERWDALRADGSVNTGSLTDSSQDEEGGGMVSFNHYANGAVGDFLYRRIAGIEPLEGGYRSFTIHPLIGGGITFCQGSIKTPYGKIESNWKISESKFIIEVAVPVSTTCEVTLPSGKKYTLEHGRHYFEEPHEVSIQH